jgi:hypothetical protein
MVSLDLIIVLAALAVAAVTLIAAMPAIIRARRYHQLRKASWNPTPIDVDGFGTVNIHPMPAAFQIALIHAAQSTEKITLYAWIISTCVEEFRGKNPHAIAMDMSPAVIDKMGEACLDVAGLTEKGRAETEKKLESAES